jgi:hypothetical protein
MEIFVDILNAAPLFGRDSIFPSLLPVNHRPSPKQFLTKSLGSTIVRQPLPEARATVRQAASA